jgi:type IV pilus assembly protein PilB
MPLNQLPLGQLLVRSGLIDQEELTVALDLQRGTGAPLGSVLVELGLASEREIIQVLSRQLQIPQMDLDAANISPDVTRFVDVQLAERYGVFPVSADPGRSLLRVATSDPNNLEALETLSAHSGMMVLFMLSTTGTI